MGKLAGVPHLEKFGFRVQSTVSNLVEFLSNFSLRNVTDDRQLQDLVSRAADGHSIYIET